jgi:hypothetical protein
MVQAASTYFSYSQTTDNYLTGDLVRPDSSFDVTVNKKIELRLSKA